MTDRLLNEYIEFVRNEVTQLRDSKFTGNIDVKFNFKEGGIANILFSLNKSVKIEEGGV